MQIFPRIDFQEWNLSQETTLFLEFLNNPDFPTHRSFILQALPELEKALSEHNNEKKAVRTFLNEFYKRYEGEIISISRESHNQLTKKLPRALRALSEAMDYSWQKKITYIATPTLLPFSPLSANRFYFSILGVVFQKEDLDVVRTAIHEISHFIFYDMVRDVEKQEKFKLPPDALYLLKESFTTALFNEEPLREILGIDNYRGNPEIRELYVKLSHQNPTLFTDHIRDLYNESRKQKRPFNKMLNELVIITYQSKASFAEKRTLWNNYGKKILSEPSLKKRYKNPILFRK